MESTGDRQTAIVTGAAQGIGRASAARLARDGMDVVIATPTFPTCHLYLDHHDHFSDRLQGYIHGRAKPMTGDRCDPRPRSGSARRFHVLSGLWAGDAAS